jgi:hypothetical protein
MADLKKHGICIKFGFRVGKTASKMHEMLKQLSVTMLWEEHRLVNAFFSSNVRKLQLKFQSIHVVPPQVAD